MVFLKEIDWCWVELYHEVEPTRLTSVSHLTVIDLPLLPLTIPSEYPLVSKSLSPRREPIQDNKQDNKQKRITDYQNLFYFAW